MKMKKLEFPIMLLTMVAMLESPLVGAKTNDAGYQKYSGTVGKYKISETTSKKNTVLYVTNGKHKVKIDSGDIRPGKVIANSKIFYTKGKKIYRCSVTGKNKKVIDSECKSSNDAGIRILAYAKGSMYYYKPTDSNFKTMKIYRYNISTAKKKVCMKGNFSYETCLDICGNYKYYYDEPTDLAGTYTLNVSKLSENTSKKLYTNVYMHCFSGNSIYYMTQDQKSGLVQYIKSDLNGKNKKTLATFDCQKYAKENNIAYSDLILANKKFSSKNADFTLIQLENNAEKYIDFHVDFSTGKVTAK